MKPNLIMTPLGQYEPAKWKGKNESGHHPIAERVLILPDGAADQTSGNVFVPEHIQERMAMAAENGVLVEAAVDAWTRSADRTGPYQGRRPEPGQRVSFQRYSGQIHHGKDGKTYRVMDDICISGIVD